MVTPWPQKGSILKIKMLETQRGSVDGCRIATYEAGVEYDLSETAGARDLAQAFVDAGFAQPASKARESVAQIPDSAPELVTTDTRGDAEAAESSTAAAQGRGRRKK